MGGGSKPNLNVPNVDVQMWLWRREGGWRRMSGLIGTMSLDPFLKHPFNLILGCFFLLFEALLGYFCVQGRTQKLGSTLVVEQLSLSMVPSILTFEFYSVLGSLSTFWYPNGLCLGFWSSDTYSYLLVTL